MRNDSISLICADALLVKREAITQSAMPLDLMLIAPPLVESEKFMPIACRSARQPIINQTKVGGARSR
jgi:hypothetical protein